MIPAKPGAGHGFADETEHVGHRSLGDGQLALIERDRRGNIQTFQTRRPEHEYIAGHAYSGHGKQEKADQEAGHTLMSTILRITKWASTRQAIAAVIRFFPYG